MKSLVIFCIVILSLWDIQVGMSQNWLPMDKGIDCFYLSGVVRAIVVDSVADKLYISGDFHQDGNCVPMRGMAQWNGQHWDSIGNATEGITQKYGLKMYRDTLYLYGNFYDVNTNEYLAKWNGSYWDTIPNSPYITTLAYAEKDGILYMGGAFDYTGVDSTFLFGKYDGTQFSSLFSPCGYGSSGFVNAMAFYNDTLYVGGYYNILPCKTLGGLGKWDGSDLQLVSPEFANNGANCNIQAMAVYNGELYMGGYFLQANGYAGNYMMKWNGTTFSDVGGGMNDRVRCMKVYNNKLYVGGDFTQAGGVTSNYVAMWDGSNWNSITTDTFAGPTLSVEAIEVYHDSLIIAGDFTSINGDGACRKIAKYNSALTGIKESHINNDTLKIYPNPATNQITIEFDLAEIKNTSIEVKNVLGQTVKTIENIAFSKGINKIEIDINEFPKGFYFVNVSINGKISSRKMIKQ